MGFLIAHVWTGPAFDKLIDSIHVGRVQDVQAEQQFFLHYDWRYFLQNKARDIPVPSSIRS